MSELTTAQMTAVNHVDGPLLILAGPGSGKTRVVTHRIAHLLERGVHPTQILAITFTNKAAREMAERVEMLAPGARVWISTFHSLCARLLRQHASGVGLTQNFSIYDTSDQHRLLRDVLNSLDVDAVHFPPARIGNMISRAKNDMLTAASYKRRYEESVGDHIQAVVAKAWPEYQKQLLQANAVDFDDLLLHVVALFEENDDLRADLDERFKYVLVDEYQDTNMAQYAIVRALAQNEPNVCVTGDPDQSIYGWRGARIENILRFERDYPETAVVRLEQNYRSTGEILRVADDLIRHNQQRKPKALITENPQGKPVELQVFEDGNAEANWIAETIRHHVLAGTRDYSDFAILYRVNSLSRTLETALGRHRVPYQIAAGVSFYDRKEIRDLLAYLRVIHNPDDRVAFKRIVNTPTRSIGKKTQQVMERYADLQGISLMDAATKVDQIPGLSARAKKAVFVFASMMQEISKEASPSVETLLGTILERSRYSAGWEDSLDEDDRQRMSNVIELLTAARQYDEANPEEGSLEEFLESCSLASEVDSIDTSRGHVTMMTLHAAKGLEFPVVFVIGLEQNLIPHERSLRENDPRELEEERRLLFVGITRAEEELILTRTQVRSTHGRNLFSIPSDFLQEMPLEINDQTESRGYSEEPEERRSRWKPVPPDNDFEEDSQSPPTAKKKKKLPTLSNEDLMKSLTTGAALAGGESGSVSLPPGFREGQRVRHPQYGRGTVTKVSGFSKRRTVTVEFEADGRTETFMVAKSPLQPIGE